MPQILTRTLIFVGVEVTRLKFFFVEFQSLLTSAPTFALLFNLKMPRRRIFSIRRISGMAEVAENLIRNESGNISEAGHVGNLE